MNELSILAPLTGPAEMPNFEKVKDLKNVLQLLDNNVDLDLENLLINNDLESLVNRYLKRKRNPRTKATLKAGLNKFVSFLEGEQMHKVAPKSYHKNVFREARIMNPGQAVKLRELKTDHLRDYRESIEKVYKSLKTQSAYATHVNTFLKWVCANTTLFVNLDELTINEKESETLHIRLPLTHEQQIKVWNVLDYGTSKGNRNAIFFRLAVEAGLRMIEINRLTLDSFNSTKPGFDVMGKGRKRAEFIRIDGELWELINEYFKDDLIRYSLAWKHYKKRNQLKAKRKALNKATIPNQEPLAPPLFIGYKGKAITTEQIRESIKALFRKSGLDLATIDKLIKPHSLRHSVAHNLLDAGVPLETVSLILRHKDMTTTRNYSKVRDQMIKDKKSANDLIREAKGGQSVLSSIKPS